MMKKLLTIVCSALCMLAFTACGNTAAPAGAPPAASGAQQAQTPPGGHKILVAYYSGTGNTKTTAERIAAKLSADLFEIVPSEPYTQADLNYNDENSRVMREHNDPSLRHPGLRQAVPDGFAAYDVVFVGYPIWWGEASWVLDDFVTQNDFTGKTVIPFCTSVSSPLGESAAHLAARAGTGTWRDGMRFRGAASADEVAAWVSELDL